MSAEQQRTKAPHTLLLIEKILSSRQYGQENDQSNTRLKVIERIDYPGSPRKHYASSEYTYSSDESDLVMSPLFDSPYYDERMETNNNIHTCTGSDSLESSLEAEAEQNNIYLKDKVFNNATNVAQNKKSLEIWDRFFQNIAREERSVTDETFSSNQYDDSIEKEVPHTIWTSENGNTPLHLAAIQGDLNKMSTLLQQGARINARNRDNQTSLGICFATGFKEGSRLIIRHDQRIRDAEDNLSSYNQDEESLLFHLVSWLLRFLWGLFNPKREKID
jgi:hypothetical protein